MLCIAILAASWFMLISPRRAEAADVRTQAVAVDDQALLLQQRIAQLKAEFADLPKRKAELKAIQEQLPPDADIPSLVRVLQSTAADSGVVLSSIAPGGPAIVTDASAPAVAATELAPAGTLVGVPMTLSISGDYFEASLFIKNLQTKTKRSFLITDLTVAPGTSAATTAVATAVPTGTGTATVAAPTATAATNQLESVNMTITGSVFVLLDGTSTLDDVKADAKAAAKSTATATPTTAPTASSTS